MVNLYKSEKTLERAYASGRLTIDFPVAPFDNTGEIFARSLKVFIENFTVIAKVTLLVFLPYEIVVSLAFFGTDPEQKITLASLIIAITPWILEALVSPAIIYAIIFNLRSGEEAEPFECLKWGIRQWTRTLGNNMLAGLAIFGGMLMLLVPGFVLTIWFFLVEPIVAIEGDSQSHVLTRSRDLTEGHRWDIFGVLMFSLMIFFALTFTLSVPGNMIDHWLIDVVTGCVIAVCGMFFTTLSLMIYLGLAHVAPSQPQELEETGPTIV